MAKQKKQLIIMLAVLVILGAGYLGLKQYNKVQGQKLPQSLGEALVSLPKDDITRFSYDYNEKEYAYTKKDDTWYYTEDPGLNLQQSNLTGIVRVMASLTAEDTIPDVEDMEQYGLGEPSRTFSFETVEESYEFWVGDYNEISDVYYICRPGENTVYTVISSAITSMNLDVTTIVQEESTETEEGSLAEE